MIRTAILAGLLLVMLSLAYGRPTSQASQAVVAALEAPPPPVAMTSRAVAARVESKAVLHAAAADKPARVMASRKPVEPDAELAAVPERPTLPAAPIPAVPAQEVGAPPAQIAHAAAPASLLPPVEPRQDQVAEAAPAPRTLAPLVPPAVVSPTVVSSVAEPVHPAAPVVETAHAPPLPIDDLPTVNVAARPVVTPWEAPPRAKETTVAVAEPAAEPPAKAADTTPKAADAPKFMTPQERSKELYKLAREMEETFITKLAR